MMFLRFDEPIHLLWGRFVKRLSQYSICEYVSAVDKDIHIHIPLQSCRFSKINIDV